MIYLGHTNPCTNTRQTIHQALPRSILSAEADTFFPLSISSFAFSWSFVLWSFSPPPSFSFHYPLTCSPSVASYYHSTCFQSSWYFSNLYPMSQYLYVILEFGSVYGCGWEYLINLNTRDCSFARVLIFLITTTVFCFTLPSICWASWSTGHLRVLWQAQRSARANTCFWLWLH